MHLYSYIFVSLSHAPAHSWYLPRCDSCSKLTALCPVQKYLDRHKFPFVLVIFCWAQLHSHADCCTGFFSLWPLEFSSGRLGVSLLCWLDEAHACRDLVIVGRPSPPQRSSAAKKYEMTYIHTGFDIPRKREFQWNWNTACCCWAELRRHLFTVGSCSWQSRPPDCGDYRQSKCTATAVARTAGGHGAGSQTSPVRPSDKSLYDVRGNWSAGRKTFPGLTSSTTNLTWTGPGNNPGHFCFVCTFCYCGPNIKHSDVV